MTVEPSDAKGIAAALGQLLDAPDRRAELASAGRKRVEALFDIRPSRGGWTNSSRLALDRGGLGLERRDFGSLISLILSPSYRAPGNWRGRRGGGSTSS